ncbi:MAG: D-alanyl-D-alanine carboxypeptidase/D-alanyl-D-alanine endopeptidase, partial [Spirulinaceae cyanobacterium]
MLRDWLGRVLNHGRWFVAGSLLLWTPPVAAQTPAACPIALPEAIAAQINQPQWQRARWGILIQNLDSGAELYRHNAEDYFLPASNAKLLTTAAALHQFGPDWEIETPLQWQGEEHHWSQLHLHGRGDPTLTTADLTHWARSLHAQGLRTIDRLTVSETGFPGHHPTWELYDLNFYYGVPVSGLILNANSFRLTVLPQAPGEPIAWETDDAIALRQWQIQNEGVTSEAGRPYNLGITGVFGTPRLNIQGTIAADHGPDRWRMAVHDPARYFLAQLRSQLVLAGITVESAAVTEPDPTLAIQEVWRSPPLAELIRATNQPSQNLYAEVLLHQLGRAHPTGEGVTALVENLSELGVDPNSYRLADGSGLSRHHLVSPEAIAQTLYHMAQSEHEAVFLASLPVGGQSGTLRRRFRATPVEG